MNMTCDDAYKLVRKMARFFSSEAPGRIIVDSDMPPGEGHTITLEGGQSEFRVGVQGWRGNNALIPDYKVMLAAGALCHEVCGHGGQRKYEFPKQTRMSRLLACNSGACESSHAYYGDICANLFSEQYANQPYEIAAQYMCLKSAKICLPMLLDPKIDVDLEARTDKMLIDYVNYRVLMQSEFIAGDRMQMPLDDKLRVYGEMSDVLLEAYAKRDANFEKVLDHNGKLILNVSAIPNPYTDSNKIFCAFNEKFSRCYNAHREYTPDSCDPIKTLVRNNVLPSWLAANVITCKNGAKQDFMMCVADKIATGGFGFYEQDVFKNIDMSPVRAFTTTTFLPWVSFRSPKMDQLVNMAEVAKGNNPLINLQDGPNII